MSNALLMNMNYLAADFLTGATYSSQLAAAPITNLYDKIRRSKVWRSNGYWEVTAANKVIKFKEISGGATLTATIAEANYVGDSAFFAAVKAALEVSGDSTYTLSRDATTDAIKITAALAGTATHFQLLCTDVAFTALDLLGFSASVNRTGALFYSADTLRIHTSEWVRFDVGSALFPEIFAMLGTSRDGLGLTSDAVVTLQGNPTDVWTGPEYEQTLTFANDCMALVEVDGLHAAMGLRYWRVKIVDKANPLGYVEIAKMYLGEAYQTATGRIAFPLRANIIDNSDVDRSRWGTAFANQRNVQEEYTFQWDNLDNDDAEEFREFREDFGMSYPFWICLDPLEAFSSDKALWIRQVRFADMPDLKLEKPNLWSSDWQCREES